MLSKILSKEQCADCGFCCVFRRSSIWETPLFSKESAKSIKKKYQNVRFRDVNCSCTVDLCGEYKTDSESEEAACFFLDKNSGCKLSDDEKPLDCKIWPLRIMKKADNQVVIALTPTCKEINKIPIDEVREFVLDGLGEYIYDQAKLMPDIIKDYKDGFEILMTF